MDKEKQIEETAKAIRPILESRTDIAYIPNLDKPIAQELVEQGYRKINENEIVISKEEYLKWVKLRQQRTNFREELKYEN